jgi:hypothetical protein
VKTASNRHFCVATRPHPCKGIRANRRKARKTGVFGTFLEKRGHAPSRIEWHFSIAGEEQGSNQKLDLTAGR